MPQWTYVVVASVVLAAATPALSGPRDRDDRNGYSQGERQAKTWHKRSAQYEKRKRLRYAERRYYYPWTRWWGPFAGPPGL